MAGDLDPAVANGTVVLDEWYFTPPGSTISAPITALRRDRDFR